MEESNKIKVMIVGDSLIFRNGLKILLETEKKLKVVGETANVSDLAVMIRHKEPNVILIDSSALKVINPQSFFSDTCKDISSIILINSEDFGLQASYLLLGAKGVVDKEHSSTFLLKAIERVNSGELWFNRRVMEQTFRHLIKEAENAPQGLNSDKYAMLTDREKEVLVAICKGMKNKVIAETLFIAETTVRHHLTSIYEKLKVNSRLELVILAFNEELVEIPTKKEWTNTDI